MTTKQKSRRVPTNSQIVNLARKVKNLDIDAKAYAEERDNLKPKLVQMMQRARTRLVEAAGVRVVLSEPTTTVYDSDGIYTSLKPSQRRLAFDPVVNLALLPAEERRELEEKMRELLTPAQRRRCTEQVFNLDRMSRAIQDGKIDIKVLDEHTEEVPKTPYTTITLK